MISKFHNLNPEKQERIINAALKQFAQKGYTQASTNEMVKEAEISKGLLFHYFKNKQDLFLYLYDYSIEMMMSEFFAKLDMKERDMLERWKQVVVIKIELMHKHPEMFQFIRMANEDDAPEVKRALEPRNKATISDAFRRVLQDIDTSKFKADVDASKATHIIFWTLEGYSNRVQEQIRAIPLDQINLDEMLKEIDEYLELLKQAFYK
ncbi:TetR family transcriptional regulator [Paenibacillus selenitireducens]|uniref:TetR family transcriptional regulator n=1 Tax=Paenibacillus selenitireducens TaxID=1324314 RepID=A0A1T2XHF0_9BACL|nr:TetR/AcrR family transcriptional regulator [Paenibacillus selenitireducens]OPA79317.1 TetR family transcriptional regulator [Paenibacillus selenitireducens]